MTSVSHSLDRASYNWGSVEAGEGGTSSCLYFLKFLSSFSCARVMRCTSNLQARSNSPTVEAPESMGSMVSSGSSMYPFFLSPRIMADAVHNSCSCAITFVSFISSGSLTVNRATTEARPLFPKAMPRSMISFLSRWGCSHRVCANDSSEYWSSASCWYCCCKLPMGDNSYSSAGVPTEASLDDDRRPALLGEGT